MSDEVEKTPEQLALEAGGPQPDAAAAAQPGTEAAASEGAAETNPAPEASQPDPDPSSPPPEVSAEDVPAQSPPSSDDIAPGATAHGKRGIHAGPAHTQHSQHSAHHKSGHPHYGGPRA